jgi:hypothetical protein
MIARMHRIEWHFTGVVDLPRGPGAGGGGLPVATARFGLPLPGRWSAFGWNGNALRAATISPAAWGPTSTAEEAFTAALKKQGFSTFTVKSADPVGAPEPRPQTVSWRNHSPLNSSTLN